MNHFAKETDSINALATQLGDQLRSKNATVSLAESCTGGWLSAAITSIAGSSEYFFGGVVAYSNQAKKDFLGVAPLTLENHGAVSSATAKEMAINIKSRCGTDLGLSITGIAGPDGGTSDKPVGLIYLGLAAKNTCLVRKEVFPGSRHDIRQASVKAALAWLIDFIQGW